MRVLASKRWIARHRARGQHGADRVGVECHIQGFVLRFDQAWARYLRRTIRSSQVNATPSVLERANEVQEMHAVGKEHRPAMRVIAARFVEPRDRLGTPPLADTR